MKSAQFIHVETYAQADQTKQKKHNSDTKQTSAGGVLYEARRVEGYCVHVEEPEAPTVLYGVDLNAVETLVSRYVNDFRLTDANGQQRRLRKDASVLLAGVVSLDREDQKIWDDYKKDTIKFLKEKYGNKLKSVIEHTDEKNPHIHFYVVADATEVLNDLHDGKKAVAEIRKQNRKKNTQKQSQAVAYTKAMTQFQDNFYFAVAKKYGLERTGKTPRTRLSRAEFKRLENERNTKQQFIKNANIELAETQETINKKTASFESEIKKQKQDAAEEIKREKVIAQRAGKKQGYNWAVKTFENKNYLNKITFTFSFNKTKLDELQSKHNKLIKSYKTLLSRKNHYKNEVIKNENFEDKYLALRKDFNRRVQQRIDNLNREENELVEENQKLKMENEEAKKAVTFLSKLQQKIGLLKFKELEADLFNKPDQPKSEYINTQKQKRKRNL